MSKETIDTIKNNVEQIGSFFSFFKKSKLTTEVFLSLENIRVELEEIPKLKENLQNNKNKYDSLKKNYTNLETTLKKLQEKHECLLEEKKSISSTLEHVKSKQLLVSSLLSSKSTNEGLEEYKKVLNNDFMEFANDEKSLANEAEAILKLQAIEKELEVITAYPELHKKNTVAVGGGFSAGKSEFISSFFNSEIKLPIGMAPTTAIPTYVMNTKINQVLACSHNGGIVDLQKIDKDFHSKISHEFIKSFDFNLKEIMPQMIVGTQFEHEHICFIDTPGYNPAQIDDDYSEDDIHTAKEFLSNASTLIWLIGADANGTIPLSDLSFLSELELENKNLYIVYNKADLKPPSDIKDVLEEIESRLEDYEVKYKGISAFSATKKLEEDYKKQSLFEFIEECNFESQVHADMLKKLYDVYSMYRQAILTDIKEKEAIQSHIKSISLDLLEEGFDDTSKPAFQKLDELSEIFTTKTQEHNLKTLKKVTQQLKRAIDKVFENEIEIDFEELKKHEIEINFKDMYLNEEGAKK